MQGVILAAGRGSRLGSLTESRPKALVPIAGVPLLTFQVSALQRAGVTEVAVVTGYCADAIRLPGGTRFHNPRWASTNMVRSLAAAREWLCRGASIVSYADIVYSSDAVARLLATDADLGIAYDPNWRALWQERFGSPALDAETFRRDPSTGRLLEIGNPVIGVEAVEGQYMGLLRVSPVGWQWLADLIAAMSPEEVDRLDITRALALLLRLGCEIQTVPIRDAWMEIDSPADLELCERMVAAGRLRLPASPSGVSARDAQDIPGGEGQADQ